MLSIDLIRKEPEFVRKSLLKRGEGVPIDRLISIDSARRTLIQEVDTLRARRNEVSKQIGELIKKRTEESVGAAKLEVRSVSLRIDEINIKLQDLEAQLQSLLRGLPNLPQEGVPIGLTDKDNQVVRTWGQPQAFTFSPLPHWELADRLGIIDFERGVKLAGSRFYVLRGAGAKLERSLINWMLDLHTSAHGYQELQLPFIVRREVMMGSGNLPKFADNLYHDNEDDLWLIPTAEVPLTGLHQDEILSPHTLPIRYVAQTPSFRREKAAAGRDTRGIKRVHQFNKVEMYKLVEPSTSGEELEGLVSDAEHVCQQLGVPYQVLKVCAGDMGFQSAETYDIEMWASGSEEWLEVSSCSNCTDFQARRSNIRYRQVEGASPKYVHTLNGSGLGLPRVLIAILENYQQADGSVIVPQVLRPYTGFDRIGAT